MQPKYKTLTAVYSIQHQADIPAGTVIEFDLSDDAEYKPDVERLLSKGVIELYTGPWPIPEPEPEPEITKEGE